jgi:hypothetical protein
MSGRLKTVVFAHIDYPDARQALQVVCWRKDFTTGKLTIERVYLITSLPLGAATGAQLAAWIRGHWKIENLLHHVRDRTFREDDSKIHSVGSHASWPACATSPPAFTARTATPTSPPPYATPPATAPDL